MKRKAVIVEPSYANHVFERAALEPLGFRIETCDGSAGRQELKTAVADAEIVFVRDTVLDADLIEAMSMARGIVRYGIGVDTIDIDAARKKGIIVARVEDYGAEIEVADHTVALLLAAHRRIVSRDHAVREGAWQVGQREPIRRLAGSVMGFLGFGRIARAVAQRLSAFGVIDLIAHDPHVRDTPENVEMVSLTDLAARADFVSLHAPATGQNHGIIGRDFLLRMQPHAILVNTARGALVDEASLFEALSNGWIRAAALDVFAAEPPRGNPLLQLPNIVISDHSAWYSEATVAAIQSGAARQARMIVQTGDAEFRVA